MPRYMSCMHTQQQVRDRIKTVTRRIGWLFLKPGDVLNLCERCQGLKRGEKVLVITRVRVVSVRRERLSWIKPADVIKEGFPGMTPGEFVEMFCGHMKCKRHAMVTRIEFEYLEGCSPVR